MNFLRNLSLFLLRILVKTMGARPLQSLISPSSTNTTAFVAVRSILVLGMEGVKLNFTVIFAIFSF